MVEQYQDNIQEYLDGSMPPGEKAGFEAQIKGSQALTEELRRYRELRILNRNKDLLEAKAMLGAVMAETPIEPDYGQYESYFKTPAWRKPLWRWFMGIFALFFLLATLLVYSRREAADKLRKLSESNMTPLENMIGFATDDQSSAAQGMKAYDKKQYAEAISLLQQAVRESPDDKSLQLYLGLSLLLQGKNTEAETLLQGISNADELVKVPAKWYLALSLLQRNQQTEARILLKNIESDTIFGEKARGVLGGME